MLWYTFGIVAGFLGCFSKAKSEHLLIVSIKFEPLNGSTVSVYESLMDLESVFSSVKIVRVGNSLGLRRFPRLFLAVVQNHSIFVNGVAPLKSERLQRFLCGVALSCSSNVHCWLHEGPQVLQDLFLKVPHIQEVLKKVQIVSVTPNLHNGYSGLGLHPGLVLPEVIPPIKFNGKTEDRATGRSRVVMVLGSLQHRKGVDRFLRLACVDLVQFGDESLLWVWVGNPTPAFDIPEIWPENSLLLSAKSGQQLASWIGRAGVVAQLSYEDPSPIAISQAYRVGKKCAISAEVTLARDLFPQLEILDFSEGDRAVLLKIRKLIESERQQVLEIGTKPQTVELALQLRDYLQNHNRDSSANPFRTWLKKRR